MSKDEIHIPKGKHTPGWTMSVVEERNEIVGQSRWMVYSQQMNHIRLPAGAFRWRWEARQKMKEIAGDRAWAEVNDEDD